jgi:flagellar FliL protein
MATAPAAPAPATITEGEAAPKPKSKKKLLIIGVAALVVAGGGAALLLPGGDETAKKEEHKEEHRLPAQYIALEPPFVVNFEAGSAAKFLQIAVQLMSRKPEMVEWLKGHDPAIRNDLLLLFGTQKLEEVSTREGKEKLRAEALEVVRQIIKAEGAEPEELEAVYFTSFVTQ